MKGLSAAIAVGAMCVSASAETIFENWSEKTAVVNIAEDGRKGWIKALPANGGNGSAGEWLSLGLTICSRNRNLMIISNNL